MVFPQLNEDSMESKKNSMVVDSMEVGFIK